MGAKTKKEKKWVRSGLNPEGTQMYRQVTVKLPVLRKNQVPPEPENPPYLEVKIHPPADIGVPDWLERDLKD